MVRMSKNLGTGTVEALRLRYTKASVRRKQKYFPSAHLSGGLVEVNEIPAALNHA